jgi:hypothetical protein
MLFACSSSIFLRRSAPFCQLDAADEVHHNESTRSTAVVAQKGVVDHRPDAPNAAASFAKWTSVVNASTIASCHGTMRWLLWSETRDLTKRTTS